MHNIRAVYSTVQRGVCKVKAGDLVRFKSRAAGKHDNPQNTHNEWRIGILVKYETWEKVGTVLYMRTLHRVRAENIQKAGKKDEKIRV